MEFLKMHKSIIFGLAVLTGILLGTLFIAKSAEAATPPATVPQGGTGWGAFGLGNIPIGAGLSLPGSLRFATSSSLTFATSTGTLSVPYASTTAISAVSVCLTGDTCRTTWPSPTGGSGLATTSPVSAGNVLTYSSAGAGSAFGTATGTLAGTSNQIAISATVATLLAGGTLSFPQRLIFPLSFESTYGTTTFASSTALTATNLYATNYTLGSATGLVLTTSGVGSAYAGTSCTNQFVRSLSASGVGTCASVANTDLSNSSITINGTSVSLGGSITVASTTLLADLNTFTNKQVINFASTTAISASGSFYTPTSVTDQFKYNNTNSPSTVRVIPYLYSASFSYATTAWAGTTTLQLGVASMNETWKSVLCYTDTGTVQVSFKNNTSRMDWINASTTVGTTTLTTNNAIPWGTKRSVDVGTPVSSPTYIACSVNKTWDAN